MTRSEFLEMITALLEAGKITLPQAAMMRHTQEIGRIADASLPIPWRLLPGKVTRAEVTDALFHVAAFLTPKEGKQMANTASRKQITNTPPEVRKFLRERLRNHLRGDFEGTMTQIAKGLANGGNVDAWHKVMVREQRAYIARQMTAGLGRALTDSELEEVNRLGRLQQGYLQGFAAEVSARRILGNEFSEPYLINRHKQYGGMGWGAWFRGNEIAEARGDGYVILYIARDDNRTCGPCFQAQANSPYLPGSANIPYPGEVCQGHGLCRCHHETVFDMQAWRRLKGLPEKEPIPTDKAEALAQKQEQAIRLRETARLGRLQRQAERDREKARQEEEARLREAERAAEAERARLAKRRAIEAMRPALFNDLDTVLGDARNDPETLKSLQRALINPKYATEESDRLLAGVRAYMEKHKIDTRSVKTHGLAEAEQMEGFFLEGTEIRWTADSAKAERAALLSVTNLYLENIDPRGFKIPKALWASNTALYFTDKKNKDDPYWAEKFGDPDFYAAATGGDGAIMVYSGRPVSVDTLSHELGHTFASEVYGKTDPTAVRSVVDGKAVVLKTEWEQIRESGEPVVSKYARHTPDEDFAESMRVYVTDREKMRESFPRRFAKLEELLRGEGEESARLAVERKAMALGAPRVSPRKGETEEERKERRRLEHLRWKERKAAEAEAAEKAAAVADEEEAKAAADASVSSYDVDRKAAEAGTKTIVADMADEEARKAEAHRVSRSLTHLRWRAKRVTGSELDEVKRRIAETEEELRRIREPAGDADARKKAEAAELARLSKLKEEEEAEARRLAEAEERRRAEEARLAREAAEKAEAERKAAEEAARKAAEEEAERIRKLEEKKEKKRLAHIAWKAKKDAEKAAAAAIGTLPAKHSREVKEIRAEIADIDAEVGRIRSKRLAGESDTVAEKVFMDTRRKELELLWAELKRSEGEDADLLAGPKAAVVTPTKLLRPVLALEREITAIEVEYVRLSRKVALGTATPDDFDSLSTTRSRVAALEKERDASLKEDATPTTATSTPKKYRHVASLESEITTIEGETGRLGRKRGRGETLTAAETEFLSKKDDRLVALRKELALSMEEDKTRVATSASATPTRTGKTGKKLKPIVIPDKKLRPVAEIKAEYALFKDKIKRLTDIIRSGTRLSPEDERFYLDRGSVDSAFVRDIIKSEEEDKEIAALKRRAEAQERSLTAGPVDLKHRADQASIDDLSARTIDDLQRQGVDPDEALAAFKDILDRHPAIINTKTNILGFWRVGEERFKTQFETGTSMGANNNQLRANAEKRGLGYSNKVDHERSMRPVYGALRTDPRSGASYGGPGGGYAWKVKDEVKARMTVTMGDSLGPFGSGSQIGTPMNDPGFEGIGATWGQSAFVEYVKSKRTQADLDRFVNNIAYIEWQCQGQLLLSDIEWVEDRGHNLTPDDIQWLEDRGIEVRR